MREVTWAKLIANGMPVALGDLASDLSARRSRQVRVYTMPMIEAGVAGLAVPFIDDDGVVFDPILLAQPYDLGEVAAHEIAHLFYPSWNSPRTDEDDDMERFASELGPMLLGELPRDVTAAEGLADLALCNVMTASVLIPSRS